MNSHHALRVWLLKYVPSPLCEASITIAVLIEEDETGAFATAKFVGDWQRITAFDPMADVEFLEGIKDELEKAWADPAERQRITRLMQDTLSNALQITGWRVVTCEIEPEVKQIVENNLERAA